jgi:hypothetical protein
VVSEVYAYLHDRRTRLIGQGLAPACICLDPGIGFGKTHRHNLALLTHCDCFHQLESPLLVGHSRKGFIAKVLGDPELTESEIVAIVAEARRHRLRIMSHAQGSESVVASARAGVDSVEHAWLADRTAIEALAASGAFLVPTLVVTDVNRELPGLTPVQRERQDLIEQRHRASCEMAIQLGVPIATGTDTGEVGVTSDMVWREIALIHDHGASPMAVRPRRARRHGCLVSMRRSARSSPGRWPISCWSRGTRSRICVGWRRPQS